MHIRIDIQYMRWSMLCHENQWNAQSLSQKFDVTIEFSYEIFPAPLFVSFWSGAVDVVGGYRNDVKFIEKRFERAI